MFTRRNFLLFSGAAMLAPQTGLAATETETLGGPAFGSYWRLTVPREMAGMVSKASIEAIVDAVDLSFSPYRPGSEISALNRADTTDWLAVSSEFRTVLDQALLVARQSGGAFDPTIGPIVSRYGFGPIESEAWGAVDKIRLGSDGVCKDDARLSLDLCGVAKGHALSRLASNLAAQGIADFLLDLGGELTARGHHPSGRSWQVAVEGHDGGLALGVRLDGRAVATSGVGAQSYALSGRLISHIIDPMAAAPVNGSTLSVSVLHSNAALADGWATGLMAMPFEKALDMAEAFGLDTLMLVRDGDRVRSLMSGSFAGHVLG